MPDVNVNQNDGSQDNNQVQTNPTDDLLKRVSGFKPSPAPENNDNGNKFNMNELDDKINAIEDGEVKDQMVALKKSLIAGENKKYQELAELKKALETNLKQDSNQDQSWTVERVQALLQDPNFVNSAQQVAGNQTSISDDSMLTEAEKKKIAEVDSIKLQNQQLLQQQNLLLQRQQDESLKAKYPDYDSKAVDTISAELLANKIPNVREYIWKAYNHDTAIEKAYKLGRQDERTGINTNVNAASYEGKQVVSNTSVKREKNESNSSLMQRLYMNALKLGKGGVQS